MRQRNNVLEGLYLDPNGEHATYGSGVGVLFSPENRRGMIGVLAFGAAAVAASILIARYDDTVYVFGNGGGIECTTAQHYIDLHPNDPCPPEQP